MRRLLWIIAAFCALCPGQSFDVASIRLSAFQKADGEGSGREAIQTSPGGLTMRNVTLRDCISWAYNLQDFQVTGGASGAVERYDIAAKASGSVTTVELRALLQSLLADRFKLTFHRETRSLPAYVLVVSRGGAKLRESTEDSPAVMRPGKASLSVAHATMWEFAGMLAGPLRTPVVDKTGLTGRYDFTVDLMPYWPQEKTGEIDLPSVVMSAIKDRLGLSLESRKEPVELLVVDHAEKSPTEN